MQTAVLQKITDKNLRTDVPEFRIGDSIRVHVKIKEGDKERLQAFEGVVIARHNAGLGETGNFLLLCKCGRLLPSSHWCLFSMSLLGGWISMCCGSPAEWLYRATQRKFTIP